MLLKLIQLILLMFFSRQEEIEAAINTSNQDNGYSDFVLMITDILNSNSEILALGSNPDRVERKL